MMRIKTYTSASVPEALTRIKKEMGPGAVILRTNRTVKKRLLGLLPTLAYEITAAADPAADTAEGAADPVAEAIAPLTPRSDTVASPDRAPLLETYEAATPSREDFGPAKPVEATARPRKSKEESPTDERWREQFERLNDEIQNLVRLIAHQPAGGAIASLFLRDGAVGRDLQELLWQGDGWDLNGRRLAYAEFQRLLREGIDESLAFLLIRDAVRDLPACEDSTDGLRIRLNRAVSGTIRTAPLDPVGGPRAIILVGPTGVGKTTTIAKLAARLVLKCRRKVRLITFDTYRIAAAEQLRTYGEIIGTPVKVLFSIDELDREIGSAGGDELLLIDTTGHSHRKVAEQYELSSYVRNDARIQKHLVLSCTTREADLREIVASFGVFGPDRILFTKLDEASSFGLILNVLVRSDKALSYLTNGQDVAEDLIIPSASTVADLLVPLN
jgi:flagellar biosynthesis protein FlhF